MITINAKLNITKQEAQEGVTKVFSINKKERAV